MSPVQFLSVMSLLHIFFVVVYMLLVEEAVASVTAGKFFSALFWHYTF